MAPPTAADVTTDMRQALVALSKPSTSLKKLEKRRAELIEARY